MRPQVLGDALHGAGVDLRVQHCSSECDYPFLHAQVAVLDGEGSLFDDWKMPKRGSTTLLTTTDPDLPEVANALYWATSVGLRSLSNVRSVTRRLNDLEQAVRMDAAVLLETSHETVRARQGPLLRRIKDFKAGGERRRKSGQTLSRIWWTLSVMNAMRSAWERESAAFERQVVDSRINSLTRLDRSDLELVRTHDLSTVTAAIEQTATRMDTRFVGLSTGWGAVLGAIAGGLLGEMISAGS